MQGDDCESYFALFPGPNGLWNKYVYSSVWILQLDAKMKSTQSMAGYVFKKNLFISLWWAVRQQVSSTLFGHRWFLRMVLTVARVEAISLLHPSRAVIGNGAEPVWLHYLWLKARGKHLPEALCLCSKVTLINWERGRILHLAERSGP